MAEETQPRWEVKLIAELKGPTPDQVWPFLEEETQPRWEVKLIAELKGPTPDQVWPFLEDFCNLHKLSSLSLSMAEETQPRWEVKLIAELKGPTPDQVWPFLEDFCNLHKLLPTLDTCHRVEGVPGQPGLVRYVASTTFGDDSDPSKVKWANERLLMMDPSDKCFSYEILDNNIGLKYFAATIRVMPVNDEDGKMVGCMIEWSVVADPVEGWGFQDMRSFYDFCLQSMAKKIESAIQETSG